MNLFIDRCPPRPSELVLEMFVRFRWNWNLKISVFEERVKPEYPKTGEKSLGEKKRLTI